MSEAAPTRPGRDFARHLAAFFDSPVDRRLFNIFKAFLALKLYLGPILGLGPSGAPPTLFGIFHLASSGSSLILLLACVITIASPSHYKFGLWIFLVRKFSVILGTLPMTPNHVGLEFLLLLILLIFPATKVDATSTGTSRAAMVDGRACRLILFAIVSIYFWSGIQKLYHGFYLNGEFFTFILFATKGEAAGGFFRTVILFLVDLLGQPPLPNLAQPNWLIPQNFEHPSWVLYFFIAQCWMAVIGEIAIPILLLFKRTRRAGKVLLLPLALMIALISGETDFALTNFACLLLFFPRQANWAYPAATLAVLIVHYTRIFGVFSA